MHLPVTPALPLRTARQTVRQFRPDDLEALLAFHSDADAVRYVPFPPRDRAGMADQLARKATSTTLGQEGDLLELAVTFGDDETVVVGDVLLALRSVEHETLEIGYLFSPAYGGHSYTTEPVRALLDLVAGAPSRPARSGTGRQRVGQWRADQRGRRRGARPRVGARPGPGALITFGCGTAKRMPLGDEPRGVARWLARPARARSGGGSRRGRGFRS